MRVEKIGIKNLNSLVGEFEIDLTHPRYEEDGIFAIVGPTGSGKTTLLDAMSLALYGRTPRCNPSGSSNEVMSRGYGSCYARVVFSTQVGRFEVLWSQKRAREEARGNLQPPVHSLIDVIEKKTIAEKTSEVLAFIYELTGMNFDHFTKAVLLAQGGFARFLQAKSADKATILEQITGSEIYSLISQKVYQNTKNAREELKLLEKGIDFIPLLNEKDREALNADFKQVVQEKEVKQEELTKRREHFLWCQEKKILENKLTLAKNHESIALEKLFESKGLEKTKNQAERAEVIYQEHLKEVERLRGELQLNIKHQKEIKALQLQLDENVKVNEKEFNASQQEVLEAVKIMGEYQPLIERAKQINEELKNTQESLLQYQEVLTKERVEYKNSEQVLLALQKNKETLKQESKILSDELVKIKEIQPAANQLPLWESEFERCSEIHLDLKDKKREKDSLLEKSVLFKTEMTQCDNQIKDYLLQLEKNEAELEKNKKIIEESLGDVSEEKFQEEYTEYLKLEGIKTQYRQYCEILETLQEKIEVEKDKKENANVLYSEDKKVLEELEKKLEAYRQQLKKEQHYRDEIQREEIFIHYRQGLLENTPCPLCGSLDHPKKVEEKSFEKILFDDQLEAKIELVQQKFLAEQLKEVKSLAQLRQYDQNINSLLSDVEEWKKRLSELSSVKNFNSSEAFIQRYNRFINSKKVCESISHDLVEINREKNNLELRRQLNESLFFQKQHEISEIEKYMVLKEEALTTHVKKLKESMAPFHQEKGVEAALRFIKKQLEYCAQLMEKESDIINKIQENAELIFRAQEMYSTVKIAYETKRKIEEQLEIKIEALLNQLQELALPFEIETGENILRERVEKAQKKEKIYEKIYLDSKEKFSKNAGVFETMKTSYEQLEIHCTQREKELLEVISSSEFHEEEEIRRCRLSSEELNQIVEILKKLENDAQETTRVHQQSREAHEEHLKKRLWSFELEESERMMNESVQAYDVLMQRVGSISSQLTQQQAYEKQMKEELEKIKGQQRDVVEWEKLDTLIGSAKGDKFSKIVQAMTFERLIYLANKHLKIMCERYSLKRDQGSLESLDLVVIDYYRGSEIRSIENLSGGETFIISLALSLALSQFSSQRIQIDTLFLDEGFGTLDEESLQTVLSTLSGLHQTGKVIGIISHVQTLKECIPLKIEIIPKKQGESTISGIGCFQRN